MRFEAPGLSRGGSRWLLPKEGESNTLSFWLWRPRACPGEVHVGCYNRGQERSYLEAPGLSRGGTRWLLPGRRERSFLEAPGLSRGGSRWLLPGRRERSFLEAPGLSRGGSRWWLQRVAEKEKK